MIYIIIRRRLPLDPCVLQGMCKISSTLYHLKRTLLRALARPVFFRSTIRGSRLISLALKKWWLDRDIIDPDEHTLL